MSWTGDPVSSDVEGQGEELALTFQVFQSLNRSLRSVPVSGLVSPQAQ